MADATRAGGDLHPATGKAEDWFELLNESAKAVDLSGYILVDSQADNACAIPDGVTLPPGACLRVWAGSGLTLGTNTDGSVNATFGLSKSGDAIALKTPSGDTELDRVTFDAQTSDVSRGRWPNGASGDWVSFSRPTPGLPNRSPSAVGLLPLYGVQPAAAEQTLTLSFAPAATVSQAVYALADGREEAAIDGSGTFSWTPPATLASGVYAFRIALMGLTNGAAVTDETTLLVALSNTQRLLVEGVASPPEGGTVSGGGAYAEGDTAALTATAADGWRFAKWSDGLTSPTRSITVNRDVSYCALFIYDISAPSGASGRSTARRRSSIGGGFPAPTGTSCGAPPARPARFRRSAPFRTTFTPTPPRWLASTPTTPSRPSAATPKARLRGLPRYTNGVTRKVEGTAIGTLGSYSNSGRTREKVFDGDIATFYDAAADGGWPGWDLGAERPWRLSHIRFVPRESLPGRMVGGRFQISATSDGTDTFESPETLYTVTATPPTGVYTRRCRSSSTARSATCDTCRRREAGGTSRSWRCTGAMLRRRRRLGWPRPRAWGWPR
jgi:hypothetical protein